MPDNGIVSAPDDQAATPLRGVTQSDQDHDLPPGAAHGAPATSPAAAISIPVSSLPGTAGGIRSSFITDAYAKVPGIGEGNRWYDYPYRGLGWLQRSWRRKLLPRRCLSGLNYLSNYLIPFGEHERNKIWDRCDPRCNLFVPPDEHVALPAIWVVELFPPSEFASLSETIAKNSWDKRRVYIGSGDHNMQLLERSRGERGWTWWRLAEIASPDSGFHYPEGTREVLPDGIESVELKALQIGSSLTAVVARFMLTPGAAQRVDQVWHEPHEPQLTILGHRRPRAEDRMWAGMRVTQEARRALHDQARGWLKKRCPGSFASNGKAHPLMDLVLFQIFDPSPGLRQEPDFTRALRALGLDDGSVRQRTSPSLPGLILSPSDPGLCPAIGERSAALWGNVNTIASGRKNLRMYGSAPDRAIAHVVDDAMDTFLVLMAISDLLTDMEKSYAILRDTARIRHGKFQANDIRELRATFLTLSLDLASLSRDVDAFWDAPWHKEDDAQFVVKYTGEVMAMATAVGDKPAKPRSLNELMRDDHRERFQQLCNIDSEYRSILSTVANLGASVDTFKVSRLAIWVAAASLAIASITLLLTNLGPESVLTSMVRWIQRSFLS